MSGQAIIDSLEFARTAQELQGKVPIAEMPRLHDCVLDTGGAVNFTLTGGRDGRNRPGLHLEVNGVLHLRCERCLGLLDFPVSISSDLLLLESAAGFDREAELDQPADTIDADPQLDVWGLVEDEILLSLPISPRHAEGECEYTAEALAAVRDTAFAALAGLKK